MFSAVSRFPRITGLTTYSNSTNTYSLLAKQFHAPMLPFLLKGVYGVPGGMQADGIHATASGNKTVAENLLPLLICLSCTNRNKVSTPARRLAERACRRCACPMPIRSSLPAKIFTISALENSGRFAAPAIADTACRICIHGCCRQLRQKRYAGAAWRQRVLPMLRASGQPASRRHRQFNGERDLQRHGAGSQDERRSPASGPGHARANERSHRRRGSLQSQHIHPLERGR